MTQAQARDKRDGLIGRIHELAKTASFLHFECGRGANFLDSVLTEIEYLSKDLADVVAASKVNVTDPVAPKPKKPRKTELRVLKGIQDTLAELRLRL